MAVPCPLSTWPAWLGVSTSSRSVIAAARIRFSPSPVLNWKRSGLPFGYPAGVGTGETIGLLLLDDGVCEEVGQSGLVAGRRGRTRGRLGQRWRHPQSTVRDRSAPEPRGPTPLCQRVSSTSHLDCRNGLRHRPRIRMDLPNRMTPACRQVRRTPRRFSGMSSTRIARRRRLRATRTGRGLLVRRVLCGARWSRRAGPQPTRPIGYRHTAGEERAEGVLGPGRR